MEGDGPRRKVPPEGGETPPAREALTGKARAGGILLAQEAPAAVLEFAQMIVDTVREGLLVLSGDLRVRNASRSFYEHFHVTPERTVGRLVYELGNGQWDIPELRRLLEDVLPRNEVFNDFDVTHDFEDLGPRAMLLNARRLSRHQLILLAIEDVTERRRGAHALRASEEHLRLLVDSAKEYAIFAMDEGARIEMWSPGAERILGWTREEAHGQLGEIIFTPEDRTDGVPARELQRAAAEGSALDERWHVRKDGSAFWASGAMMALRDGGDLRGFAKILRDNTEQKRAEDERDALLGALAVERSRLQDLNATLEARVAERTKQVRALASTLAMAEQEERRRISQILHDDVQQLLYGIQMKAFFARQDIEAERPPSSLAHLADVEAWIRQAIQITRRLTVDLSPPVLKDEGLTDALRWLATQMQDMHGLTVDLHAEHAFRMPHEDMRVLLFQLVRELLFNVVKHAATDRAAVALDADGPHLVIRVTDAGAGFDVAAVAARAADARGFGLFSVRERLALFGGRMDVASAPGEGTRITIHFPVMLEEAPASPDL